MTTKNNVPQIRFKEVCGEWNEQYLEHIADVLDGDRGFNYPKHEDLQTHGHTLFLSAANVTLDGFKFLNNQYISEEKSSSMGNGKLVVNDIVLTSRGSLGNVAWYNENIQHEVAFARINSGMLILRMKNYISPCIVTHILKSPLGQRKINLISFGSAQPQLTKSGVAKLSLILPQNKFEQKKIGEYFQHLDKLIEQKENKLQKLQQFKKSMLAKMFPVNGADTPSIRFTGFTDNWQKKTLGDLGKTFTGLSGKTKNDFGHGKARFVTYMNVFTNLIARNDINEEIEIDVKQNEVKLGDVFFTTSSETPEEVGMSSVWLYKDENVYLNSFCFGFRPEYLFDHHYLAFMLRSPSFRNKIIVLAQGISRYNISKNKVMELTVYIPEYSEQTKIGNYFKKLDKLIDLQQQELEKLKNLKKAFLAKMFV